MISNRELDEIEDCIKAHYATIVRRKRGKMSIYRLARICNVDMSTIRRIEQGKGCTIGVAAKVSAVLDINILIL